MPIDDILQNAKAVSASGNGAGALALLERAHRENPYSAKLCNAIGLMLVMSQPETAAGYFRKALAIDPDAIALWLNLADALRRAGLIEAEVNALDEVLSRDPYQAAAMVGKAYALEKQGRMAESLRMFDALIRAYPLGASTPAPIREAITHGLLLIAGQNAEAALGMDPRIEELITDAPPIVANRARHFADLLFGRKQVHLPQPTGAYYPNLPAVSFFDRADFPWFAQLEAATEVMCRELAGLIGAGSKEAVPYVQFAPGTPVNQWHELNHSPKWSAFFLVKDGQVQPDVALSCPQTLAAIQSLPLMDTPGKAPTVLFSVLQPHTRIPGHTGTTNVRATVHLPLVVPPSCRFRVGSDVREWRYGEAWAFDDTIEHEAWNDSDLPRTILIADAWNPYLTDVERAVVRVSGV